MWRKTPDSYSPRALSAGWPGYDQNIKNRPNARVLANLGNVEPRFSEASTERSADVKAARSGISTSRVQACVVVMVVHGVCRNLGWTQGLQMTSHDRWRSQNSQVNNSSREASRGAFLACQLAGRERPPLLSLSSPQ